MLGAVVVLFNPELSDIRHINTYIGFVDFLIVMDNSPDNNAELLRENIVCTTNYDYHSHVENIGLCRALNEGIYRLKEMGYDWVFTFDSDSRFMPNIIEIYKLAIVNKPFENIAVFTPQHTFDRSPKQPYSGFKIVKWAMTSGWLINVHIFLSLGGFFEELFVDDLDIDYCYRARKKGYVIIEIGEAVIEHHPAKTQKINFLGKTFLYGCDVPDRYFMQARGLIWNLLRYKSLEDLIGYLYKWFKVLFLFKNKKEYIKAMIKGTIAGKSLYFRYRGKKITFSDTYIGGNSKQR